MSYVSMSASREAVDQQQAVLRQIHGDVGSRRQQVIAALDAIGEEEAVLSIQFGDTRVCVTKRGDVVTHERGFELHADLTIPVPGAVPGNKRIGDVIIPCGLVLIVGAGGVGKTPLAHALAAEGGVAEYGVVRVGEPLSGYTSDEQLAAQGLATAILRHSDVVVDSIKDLLALGGAAMKAGISRRVLVTLSAWSRLACELGCTLYVPINPSSDDEAVKELLAEAARSNATATLTYHGDSKWKFFGRTGEGLERVTADISFESGEVAMKGKTAKQTSSARELHLDMSSSINKAVAIHRAIVPEE